MNRIDTIYVIAAIICPIIILLTGMYSFPIFINRQFTLPNTLFGMCLLLFIAPILEEVVFRGLIQDTLMQWVPKISQDVTALSHGSRILLILLGINCGFTILHYRVNHSYLYLILVFISGMIFSVVKLRYAKIIYPIALHIYYNCLFVIVLIAK